MTIGSIMYDMPCSRPDVAFSLSMVNRYQRNPYMGHWRMVKNIIKYLQKTKGMILVFGGKYELKVSGYNDPTFKQIDITIILNSSWFFY